MGGGQQLRSLFITSKPDRALTVRFMGIATSVQPKVAFPAVRDGRGACLAVIGAEGAQRCCRGPSHLHQPASAVAARFVDLHRDARRDLVAPAFVTTHSRISAADVSLAEPHGADQALAPRTNEDGLQPVKHGPQGLIGTDIEQPLQAQRSDRIPAGGEQPAGGEPQGHARAVEDRCGGDGATHTARGALAAPVAQTPAVTPQTSRADETGRSAQPFEAVQAVGTDSKPSLELA